MWYVYFSGLKQEAHLSLTTALRLKPWSSKTIINSIDATALLPLKQSRVIHAETQIQTPG